MDDPEPYWRLFHAVVADGAVAWPPLAAELEPVLLEMANNQPIGRLKDREDSPREIVIRVFARLHKREFETIKRLCSLSPRPELRPWLRVIVKRSAIDYMRESPEYERGNAKRAHRWVSLATLSSRAVAPKEDSLNVKRDMVLVFVREAVDRGAAFAAEHGIDEAIVRLALEWKIDRTHVRRLIQRGGQYMKVLAAVLSGHSYPETAEQLGITRRECELTVRYIEDLLEARRFASND